MRKIILIGLLLLIPIAFAAQQTSFDIHARLDTGLSPISSGTFGINISESNDCGLGVFYRNQTTFADGQAFMNVTTDLDFNRQYFICGNASDGINNVFFGPLPKRFGQGQINASSVTGDFILNNTDQIFNVQNASNGFIFDTISPNGFTFKNDFVFDIARLNLESLSGLRGQIQSSSGDLSFHTTTDNLIYVLGQLINTTGHSIYVQPLIAPNFLYSNLTTIADTFIPDTDTTLNLTPDTNILLDSNVNITQNVTVDSGTLFVDSNNDRIGIGNTAPAVRLEVGDATGEEIIRVSSGVNSNAILSANSFFSTGNPLTQYIVAGGNNWVTGVDNADSDKYKISFHITDLGTNNFLAIDTTGDVGIGTSSPDSALHIKANTPGTVGSHPAGQLIIQDPDDTVFGNAVITGYESDGSGNPDQQLWYLGSSSSSNSNIIFLNRRNALLQFGTNGNTQMTILGNGDVGIGTTSPSQKLTVIGNANVTGIINAPGGLNMSTSGDIITNSSLFCIGFPSKGTKDPRICFSETSGRLEVYHGTSLTYRFLASGIQAQKNFIFLSADDGRIEFRAAEHSGSVALKFVNAPVSNPPESTEVFIRFSPLETFLSAAVDPGWAMEMLYDGSLRWNRTGMNLTFGYGRPQNYTIQHRNETMWFSGNITAEGNITSSNVFVPHYLFAHTNATIPLIGADIWTNITFLEDFPGEGDIDIKFGIAHIRNDATNQSFTILEDGVYDVEYDYDIVDTSIASTDVDVAGRAIFNNGTEIIGSIFETDLIKKNIEGELSHTFLVKLKAGDVIILQFIASVAGVEIQTHGTFGDHFDSATITIKKVANLL